MTKVDWIARARELGGVFSERAARYDRDDVFAVDNYAALRESGYFAMAVPSELGGGGASYEEVCQVLFEFGRCCASTALALSMHTHLVAANVWKYRHDKPDAEPLLRKVAQQQLVLVSTGATDWIDSNGSARRVEGGYRVTARKAFASGCPGADVLVTSIACQDEAEGPKVLHFSLPIKAPGVRLEDDWHTLGMRATGSHTVVLEDAFVPDAAVGLVRPRGQWHAVWNVVLGVAPAIYVSPYVGLAQAAVEHAMERAKAREVPGLASAVGELENARTAALLAWRDMLRVCGEYDFEPSLDLVSAQLVRKTLAVEAARRAVELAVEVAGSIGFFQISPIERAWRDVQASQFHPLPRRRQIEFTGRVLLGRDVVGA